MILTFGSLFAGIGGIDLGLERAGMTCKWQVEIDPFCSKVLAKHWPDVRRYGDVKECGSHNLAPVDLIAGGFPCQPHSVAGKRQGKEDDRNLWPEYRRVVGEMRPRWVLAENVPGIRQTMLDEVLSDLEGLAYTVGTLIVPACAFDAPHRRERVFIVAYANGREQGRGQQPKRRQDKRNPDFARDGTQGNAYAAAYAESNLRGTSRDDRPITPDGGSPLMADASRQLRNGGDDNGRSRPRPLSQSGDGTEETRPLSSWWAVEPDVGRVADGIPSRVDRLRALGNAVVPQVAEWIGRQIVKADVQ